MPLEKVITLDLQKLYKKLLTEGRVVRIESEHQPAGLCAKTVRNINQIISSAMDMAIEQQIILRNPTKGCALPRIERKEMHTIQQEDLAAFLREARATGVYELYYTDLATGLRRGELLGLKWEDVDLENGLLRVKRQVARINGVVQELPLKTKNSYRTIPLSEDTVAVLRAQKEKTHDAYVFPSLNGGPISPDSVRNMLKRVLERAGLPDVRFHDLRHRLAGDGPLLSLRDISPAPRGNPLRHPGSAKRGGHQDRERNARPLLRRLHPGHLRPRHHRCPEGGRQQDRWGAQGSGRRVVDITHLLSTKDKLGACFSPAYLQIVYSRFTVVIADNREFLIYSAHFAMLQNYGSQCLADCTL